MSVSSFDFGELFTLSTRPVIAVAMQRGLGFYFDFASGPTRVHGDAQHFQRSVFRIIAAADQVLRSGFLILSAEAEPGPTPGTLRLRVDAAGSGQRVPDADIDRLLDRLDLKKAPPDPADPEAVTAHGLCPVLGGEVRYRCVPSAGALFSLTSECAGEAMPHLVAPHAHGCHAFLLYDGHDSVQGLGRRLRRLGWDVALFQDAAAFAHAVATADSPHRLAIAIDSPSVGPAELEQVNARLAEGAPPDGSLERVHAVRAGSTALGTAPVPGWQTHIVPFLPSELWDFTRPAEPDDEAFHHESRPQSLPSPARPRVLVVDDDEVNRIIASGLLQMIGYDAQSAASGDEAIALCQRGAPDLVLMDINMPGIDGYQATAALKRLQRTGGIPPFPIIAATAAEPASRALEHGLDGHLTKPLLAEDLRLELHRVLKGVVVGP